MGKQAKPKQVKSGRNDERSNGKAYKQNPKDNSACATGRTVGGYTPNALARRTERRTALSMEAPILTKKRVRRGKRTK
jgi:hypothetical protein